VWPQVYVGGFVTSITSSTRAPNSARRHHDCDPQPRGVGTFTSPNEFGAYLSICLALTLAPGVVRMRPVVRTWLVVAFSLALLLTFSRSGMLSTVIAVGTILLLQRDRISLITRTRRALSSRSAALGQLSALVVGGLLVAFVLSSSGASDFVGQTVGGASAAFDNVAKVSRS
jgi:hypothetical protein